MLDLDRLLTPEERLGADMPDDRERDGACTFDAPAERVTGMGAIDGFGAMVILPEPLPDLTG